MKGKTLVMLINAPPLPGPKKKNRLDRAMFGGMAYLGKPPGQAGKLAHYTARDYHTVNDVVQPDWDMAGAAQDAELLFPAGYRAAQNATAPQWKAGAEFKAVRETPAGK